MKKIKVRMLVDFYFDGDLDMKEVPKVVDKIRRNINGWQYSRSEVLIEKSEDIVWQAIPTGSNRIYKEDLEGIIEEENIEDKTVRAESIYDERREDGKV